ncbi:xanthine dehydrogenase family protein molybdopterin-binding subunit [Acidipila rosea]|uniref:Xanthine dehydrogenase YagR molybdenum-binding subunit n=1 Tax=Acidipila rosea TaxID=768535 RepID=A0A4R1L9D8_9BACT|nr:xanthine dehydrogenase family protein molybdopterin-binding subunit [Acidipila rosea]TCK73593.1 xanthine dehydrogenase YagR molybdenum-binding subunit [Acidipila rosea]
MAPETMLQEAQDKSTTKGAQTVARPKGDGVKRDSQTPSTPSKPGPGMRSDSFVFGIPQNGLEHIEREVPVSEPPPLPQNSELTYVGKPTVRYDGPAKATGKGKYTADVHLPGMLYARMVDATIPHGRIVSIDTSAAEKLPGVRAVHVIEHVYGVSELRDPKLETPSRYPIVRYAGQPIAGIAATTQQIADDAAKLVKVQYDTMPFVVERNAARSPDAPVVFPGPADAAGSAGGGGGPKDVPQKGNVHGPQRRLKGDPEKGFADADAVVEAEYFTQVQTHSALETHGFVVDWKPEEVTVYASTQGTSSVRNEFADVFKLPKSKVRVITEYMGGGFGAKFGAGNEGVVAANLSRKANAPVRLMLDRRQEHIVSNRPDSHQKLKIGAKRDGTLTAIQLTSYGTAGVGTGAGTAGPATNLYKCDNLLTEEYDVFINAGPGAAFRAPGHPQGCFAFEQAIDELAVKLKMDPLVLRDKIDESPARRVERQVILERTNWRNRREAGADSGPIKRGMGIAQSVWYRFVNMNSSCEVRVSRDGSVELMSAVQDLGTGTKTILAQIVGEEFGIPPAQVVVRIGDTRYPIGPDSGGSITAGSITPAVRNAAYQARQQLFAAVAPALGTTADNLAMQGGRVVLKNDAGKSYTLKQVTAKLPTDEISARATRAPEYSKDRLTYGGVDYVELAVDTETGRVHIEKVFGAHDCGRPINPTGVISQINGGILQGISYALFEQRIMDPKAGYMLNANLENYKILGAREVPEIEIALVENYIAQSSTDAAGIGESAGIITLAAAIGNAFYNATGVRIRKIPMTPANVLAALGKAQPEVEA